MAKRAVIDEPITSQKQDKLNRVEFASSVASFVGDKVKERTGKPIGNLSIAITGEWGHGKTSLLNLISEQLEKRHVPIHSVLWFNPWRYRDEDELIKYFFTILDPVLPKEARPTLLEYGKRLAKATTQIDPSVLGIFTGEPISTATGVVAGIKSAKAVVTELKPENSLESLKKKINARFKTLNAPVVVLIDDIDRLFPMEIAHLLKLIRLNADFDNLIYISAFDIAHVEYALGAEKITDRPRQYIEKMFHVPFAVPSPSPRDLQKILIEGLNDVAGRLLTGRMKDIFNQEDFDNAYYFHVLPYFRSVRDIVRYVAGIEAACRTLRGNVDALDLLLVELLRIHEPSVFGFLCELVRTNEQHLICHEHYASEGIERSRKKIMERLNQLKVSDRALGILGVLFTQKIGKQGMGYSRHFNADAGRVEDANYFDRYFTSQITGLNEDTYLEILKARRSDKTAKLKELVKQGLAYELLEKIEMRAKSMNPDDALSMAELLLMHGDEIGHKKSKPFLDFPDFWYISIAIDRLLYPISTKEPELVKKLLTDAYKTSSSFMTLIHTLEGEWDLMNPKEGKEQKRDAYMSKELAESLIEIIWNRAKTEYITPRKFLRDEWCPVVFCALRFLKGVDQLHPVMKPLLTKPTIFKLLSAYKKSQTSQTIGSVHVKEGKPYIQVGMLNAVADLNYLSEKIKSFGRLKKDEKELASLFEKSQKVKSSRDLIDDE